MSIDTSTSTTFTPEFPKEKYIEVRIADRLFCERYFPGHTSIASSIDDIVHLMGGEVLLKRYTQACENALPHITTKIVDDYQRRRAGPDVMQRSTVYTTPWDWINDIADRVRPFSLA